MLVWLAILVGVLTLIVAWRERVKDKKLDREMEEIRREIASRER